jgi:hypothetical protein
MNSSLIFGRLSIYMCCLPFAGACVSGAAFLIGWKTLFISFLSPIVVLEESFIRKISSFSQSTTVGLPSLGVCL